MRKAKKSFTISQDTMKRVTNAYRRVCINYYNTGGITPPSLSFFVETLLKESLDARAKGCDSNTVRL